MDELGNDSGSNSFAASEFHNLGVFNAHMSHSLLSSPPYLSSLDSEALGTGYLQDALFEFGSKRRRFSLFTDDQHTNCPIESCWSQNCYPDSFECLGQENEVHSISGRSKNNSGTSGISGENSSGERERVMREKTQGGEEAISAFQDSSHHKYSLHPLSTPASGGDQIEKKRKVIRRVVYPFAVVKSGGIEEGDITLKDINHRILKPPTRPVRHPVGDFATRPFLLSGGRGLSGKAVVALTKIQTQGSGTITIIRTKG